MDTIIPVAIGIDMLTLKTIHHSLARDKTLSKRFESYIYSSHYQWNGTNNTTLHNNNNTGRKTTGGHKRQVAKFYSRRQNIMVLC